MAVNGGPGTPIKIKAAERRILALELRKKGLSYRKIATTLKELYPEMISPKYSEGLAHKDIMDCLMALSKVTTAEADAYRQLELERLDALFPIYYQKAEKGDSYALGDVLSIMGKRAALLGLNAPVKIDQTSLNVAVTADDLAAAKAKALAYEKEQLGDDAHQADAASGE